MRVCIPGIMILLSLIACVKETKMEKPRQNLSEYLGFKISLTGRVSEMPWQHLIRIEPDFPHVLYLDWEGGQTVVYCRELPECGGPIMVTGTVILSEGSSKKPGSVDKYAEYQLLADRVECLAK